MPTSPKPATQSKRPYWVWGVVGCSFIVLLSFAGCVAGISYFGQRMYTEIQKPVNEDDILTALKDIPIYQPSEFDPDYTKALRASAAILPKNMVATNAGFISPDSANTIISWYKTQMLDLGYESEENNLGFIRQITFSKGRDSLLVQLQKDPSGPKGGSQLSLSHFQYIQPPAE